MIEDGTTPLMLATIDGSPDVVELLLAAGADGSVQDEDGWIALTYAARFNPDPQVIAALIRAARP